MTQLSTIDSGIPEEWLREKAPLLAWDIVAQIDGAAKLATGMYALTPAQWDTLRTSKFFVDMVSRTQQDLAGPAGTVEIAKRKAALALEQMGVLNLADIMGDSGAPPQSRIAAYKELRETAGIVNTGGGGASPNAAPAGFGGPLVVINMPARGTLTIGAHLPPEQPPEPVPAIEGEAQRV
jgi:hypothetical protein